MSSLEEAKSEYLLYVEDVRAKAMKGFKSHLFKDCYFYMQNMMKIGTYAYDMDLLKNTIILRA